MLVIRDRYGAQLRVAPPMQTQHATTQDDRATVCATANGSTPSEPAPVLELRTQQHSATCTQLGSVIAQQATQGSTSEVADPNGGDLDRRQLEQDALLREARRVLGWRDADCEDWIADAQRDAAWAVEALKSCIENPPQRPSRKDTWA